MKEKFRFQVVSKLRIVETNDYQKEVQKDTNLIESENEERQQYIEMLVYDMLFEQTSLLSKFESLNTNVEEVAVKQTTRHLYDIYDIKLFDSKINQLISFNTDIEKSIQIDDLTTESVVSPFDFELGSTTLLKQNPELSTELIIESIGNSLETSIGSESQTQLSIFEEFINCDKRFPRSFSESFNSPLVILIGEDKYEWHIPIIYALKELFCEITDKYPKVTFREPEVWEEGIEELVDSLDPHSLDQFSFEYKIELLDARKTYSAVEEFVKVIKGRLKSGFLQQFGVLVVAVRPKYLEKVKKIFKLNGLHVYTCLPDDTKYEIFCSKILGVSHFGEFFNNLGTYERYLGYIQRRFSIFVKRSSSAADKFQYPLKVATFIYLVNDLRNRRRKLINNFKELCKFINEISEKEIKVETPIPRGINGGEIIPDLIYSPEGKEIYIEIETLIGTFEPLKKIDETIEKYKNYSNSTIWIVLKPVSAMIHYEELITRKKAYEILYNNMRIEFKVLSLLTQKDKFRWDLVDIYEFMRRKEDDK